MAVTFDNHCRGEFLPVRWSQARLRELQNQVDEPAIGVHPVVSVLARAQILAANGDFERAAAVILAELDNHSQMLYYNHEVFHAFLTALFVIQRFDLAGILISEKFDPSCAIELKISPNGPGHQAVLWELSLPDRMSFTFDASIFQSDKTWVEVLCFAWIFPLCARFSRQPDSWRGSVVINQGDCGVVPGLAMCDARPEFFLIPDNVFIPSKGHERARLHFSQNRPRWEDRKDVALWRGATTGQITDAKLGWRSLPRIRLCEIAKGYPDLIDAGITKVGQIADPGAEEALRDAGLLRSYVPWTDFDLHKYQIDIDGNTNAWAGLFLKLLTGSPVLKVNSPRGYRQWYYGRLKAWENYVPVLADMSDLIEKIHWLRGHDDMARKIGESGRDLARSMEYDTEMDGAVQTVAAAIRYFSRKPETGAVHAADRCSERVDQVQKHVLVTPEVNHVRLAEIDMDDDIRRARQAAESDPRNSQLVASLGQLLSQAGNLPAAEECLRRAIEINPDHPAFHAALSHLLFRIGRTSEALAEVRRALDLKPDDVISMIHFANLLAKSDGIKEAEQVYRQAIQIEPTARVHAARSHFFSGHSRIEEAIEAIESAIELNSKNAEYFRHYGRLLARKGLSSEADAALRQAAALEPAGQTFDQSQNQPEAQSQNQPEAVTQQSGQEPVQRESAGPPPGLTSTIAHRSMSDQETAGPSAAIARHEAAAEPKFMPGRLIRRLRRKQRTSALPPKGSV